MQTKTSSEFVMRETAKQVFRELRKAVKATDVEACEPGHIYYFDWRNTPDDDYRQISLRRSNWSSYTAPDGTIKQKWKYTHV